MYANLTPAFLPALRASHQAYGYLEASYRGELITIDDNPRLPLDMKGQNEVRVDGSTPGVRRTLTATLAPVPGLWEALAPVGTEIRAHTVIRYPSGQTETIPQGVFDVDVQRMAYGAQGSLQLTAPDRWVRIQRARFLTPRSSLPGQRVIDQISAFLLEALPAGTAVTDLSGSTATVPLQTWDRDRDKTIQELATAASLDVYMDRNGNPVIRYVPHLDDQPVWTVDSSTTGVLISADRERNRQRTYNLVVVNGAPNDGSLPFPTQYVWDSDVNSPTFAGPGTGSGPTPPDPALAGPFGQRPTFYTSPLLTTAAQAQVAGQTILGRVTGLAAQLTLSAVSNPALDDGDTIAVQLPRERRDRPRPVETHIIDSLTVPLVPSKNAQSMATRSTRADTVQEN